MVPNNNNIKQALEITQNINNVISNICIRLEMEVSLKHFTTEKLLITAKWRKIPHKFQGQTDKASDLELLN